ncbi:MAG: transporter substrate-binding domain-containing protein [Thermoplasmata archaeon]
MAEEGAPPPGAIRGGISTVVFGIVVVVVFVLAFFVGAFASPALFPPAAPTLGDEIIVGTNTPFQPFEFRDEEGNLVGFTIDLVEEIGQRVGKTIVWSDYTDWTVLLEAGKQGSVNMIASSMTITAERDEVYDFSTSYYSANQAALVHKDDTFTCPGKECTADDVKDKTYAVQTGTTSHIWIKDNFNIDCSTTGPLFCFDDVTSVINKVKTKGADMAIMDLPAAVSFAADPANEIKAVGKIFTNEQYGMAVQEGDPLGILPLINPVIQDLIDEGFIAQLEADWGVPSEVP